MKSGTSVWKVMFKTVLNARTAMTVLLVAPLAWMPTAVSASDGKLSFSGAVTHSSCAVIQSADSGQSHTIRTVNVPGQTTLRVDALHNACSERSIPFTVGYQALSSARSAVKPGVEPGAGILTLTYQ